MRVRLLQYLKGGVFALGLFVFQLIAANYIYPWTLSSEAMVYRENGYKAQEIGDIDSAITWYQKACQLDANYASPHNDLGILYESKGWLDRAEMEYRKALAIDPNHGRSYTNLALIYERKGDLEKSAFYWMRRYKLGNPGDYWTDEARKRLEKLGLVEEVSGSGIVKDKDHENSRLNTAPESSIGSVDIGAISKAPTVTEKGFSRAETADEDIAAKERKREEEIESLERKIETPRIRRKDFSAENSDVQIAAAAGITVQPEIQEAIAPEKFIEEINPQISLPTEPGDVQAATTAGITVQPEIQKAIAPEEVIEKIAPRVSMPVELPKKKAKLKKRVTNKEFSPDAVMRKDLDAAVQLAETNLAKSEMASAGKTIYKPSGKKEETPNPKSRSNPEARKYYIQAIDFYKKGEYLKALDVIKEARAYYPEDSAILALEKKVVEKMK